MDLKPDKRHLVGGLVAAILLSGWLMYLGITSPSEIYYEPEFNAHSKDSNYGTTCIDCHTPFEKVQNESCNMCHLGGKRKKPWGGPQTAEAEFTQPEPAKKLHEVVSDMSCVECHIEHQDSELTQFLLLAPKQRYEHARYPQLVHAFIPREYANESSCTVCHTQEELERYRNPQAVQ